ncbi:hypothetical protein V1477_014629 [Vespula maculifrons]|uniref:Uncharacterized protein n=1 Tax=Vespula maculifrons TaxID=7453 RepID=A0ABD2BHZ2_VESMC
MVASYSTLSTTSLLFRGVTENLQECSLFGTREIHPLCGTKAMITVAHWIFTVNSFVTIESLFKK